MARRMINRSGIILIFLAVVVSVAILLAVLLTEKPASEPTNEKGTVDFRFDDIFNGRFSYRGYYISWISGSEYVQRSGNISKINLDSNATDVLIPEAIMKKYNVSSWWLSPDETWILLACNKVGLYRRSFFADYYAFQISTRKVLQVKPPDPKKKIQLALWGNRGTSLGFVQNNNVYWKSAINATNTHAITDTGKENKLFNGVPDWVYEEDVTLTNKAMWFSPDGRFLSFAQSNDTHVRWFPYMWYGPSAAAYTNVREIAYPKPGSPNPVVKIKLVDLNKLSANTSEVANTTELLVPAQFMNEEHYYTNVAWASKTSLLVWWLNRKQNVSITMSCNAETSTCTKNHQQTVANGWVATKTYLPPNPWVSKNGSYYLSLLPFPQGDAGEYVHIAKVTMPQNGIEGIVSELTSGTWEVGRILAFDRSNEVVYFSSTETSPRERHIYSVEVKTSKRSCLSCSLPSAQSGRCKFFRASFSDQGAWYVLGCLGPGVPIYTLHSTKSDQVRVLEDNAALKENLWGKSHPKIRNFVIPSGEYELEAQEVLPPNFSEDKKYGVLFDVYGGPGSQKVIEVFQSGWTSYLVSNFDLIVVRVDARGSGYRGERFLHAVYKMLGEYEAEDVINAGRFMQSKPYVDESKLAIWGWSYGGFLTTYVLSKGSGVFKCGMAVAPVTDWRYYDSAYTERYMDVPQSNPGGYANTSLLPRAAKFSKVDYLIVHGSGDDNVHYQHTAQMVRALTQAEVDFRVQYYTDKAHGITGRHTRRHLFRLLTKFLTESLGLE